MRSHGVDLAQSTGSQQFVGESEVAFAEPLSAGLINAAVTLSSFHDCPALGDGVGLGGGCSAYRVAPGRVAAGLAQVSTERGTSRLSAMVCLYGQGLERGWWFGEVWWVRMRQWNSEYGSSSA